MSIELECDICTEKYKLLKYLPCQHDFCLECIRKIKEKRGGRIECPKCRNVTVLDDDEISLISNLEFNLGCEECSKEKPNEDCWWCRTCEITVY